MNTRLEEIESLLKDNETYLHRCRLNCGLPVGDKSLWYLISERVALEIEKHDILKGAKQDA